MQGSLVVGMWRDRSVFICSGSRGDEEDDGALVVGGVGEDVGEGVGETVGVVAAEAMVAERRMRRKNNGGGCFMVEERR